MPGEIRTPELVVRSHSLESALQSINTEVGLEQLSQKDHVLGGFDATSRKFFNSSGTTELLLLA